MYSSGPFSLPQSNRLRKQGDRQYPSHGHAEAAPLGITIMADAGETSLSVTPTTRAQKRSWSGCSRCKKRRQKCDEARPTCGRCSTANVECVYEVKLRWGGRSFNQSRFGECISESSDKVKKLGMVVKSLHETTADYFKAIQRTSSMCQASKYRPRKRLQNPQGR